MQKITIKTESVTAKCRIFPAKRAGSHAPMLVELFPAVKSAIPDEEDGVPAIDIVLEYPTLQQFTELARTELESIGRILNHE